MELKQRPRGNPSLENRRGGLAQLPSTVIKVINWPYGLQLRMSEPERSKKDNAYINDEEGTSFHLTTGRLR